MKPAPEMTSFVHCDILGHSDWHANTEQLPQTNPVAYLSQKKDSSQSYEWLFTQLQKEMQSARQPTATVVRPLTSRVMMGKPQGIVLIGNGQRSGICSVTPADPTRTLTKLLPVQLRMATKCGGFPPAVLSHKRRMALPHQRWSLACWRCERKGTGAVDLCSPSAQCQLPWKA